MMKQTSNIYTVEFYKKYQQAFYAGKIANTPTPKQWDIWNLEQAMDPKNIFSFSKHFCLIMLKLSGGSRSWKNITLSRVMLNMNLTYGEATRLLDGAYSIKSKNLTLFHLEEKFLTEIGFNVTDDLTS